MAYFRRCPYCGCNLDPGERCDCREDRDKEEEKRNGQKTAERQSPGGSGLDFDRTGRGPQFRVAR